MDKVLLIKAKDLVKYTNLSGNIDTTKLTPFILMAQNNNLDRLLGSVLYQKLNDDYTNDNLSGDYIELHNLVTLVICYYTAAYYWSLGQYSMDNAGGYAKQAENSQILDDEVVNKIEMKYIQQAAAAEQTVKSFLKGSTIPNQFNTCSNNDNTAFNWYF